MNTGAVVAVAVELLGCATAVGEMPAWEYRVHETTKEGWDACKGKTGKLK